MDIKIIKNYIYNLSYQILVLIVPLITTPYISRVLGADGVGTYSYYFSITSYFSTFAAMGIGTYGQLKVAAKRDNKEKISKLFYEIIFTRITTTLICLIIYFLFLSLINFQHYKLFLVFSINIFAAALDISWFMQALEEFKITAIRNFFVKIISVILIFLLVKNENDLLIYAFILQGMVFVGNITLWFGIRKYVIKITDHKINVFFNIKQSFIYFIPTIAGTFYAYLDKTMIGVITKSSLENGYYEQSTKIQQIVMTLISSIVIVLVPRLTYLFSKKENKIIQNILKKSLTFILMASFPIMFGLIAISDDLVPSFLGIAFIPSIKLLKVLSLLIVINSLVDFYGRQILVSEGKQKEYNTIIVFGVFCNAFLNLVLISKYYALGACYASIISQIVVLLILINSTKRYLEVWFLCEKAVKYFLISFCMYIIVVIIGKNINNIVFSIIFQIMFGGLTYFSFLLLVKDDLLLSALNTILDKLKRIKQEK